MKKSSFQSIRKLFIYFKKYMTAMIISVIFAILGTVCTIVGPDRLQDMVNKIIEGIALGVDVGEINKLGMILISIYAIGSVLSYGQQVIMNVITQKSAKNLRTSITKKLNTLPLNYFDITSKGDILSRVTNDIDIISQMLSQHMSNLISGLVLLVGTTIMMFRSNIILSITTILSSMIGFIFMAFIMSKSQKYFVKNQDGLGKLNGHIEEIFTHHIVVKSYNGQDKAKKEFYGYNQHLNDSTFKSQFLSGLMLPIMTFAGNLSYAMIFIVGVYLILNGSTSMTIGTITAFVLYGKLFTQPLTNIAQAVAGLQQAAAASDRVFEMLEETDMKDEKKIKKISVENIKGHVDFNNVKFGYIKDKEIIHDFSLNVEPGQKVAIVGPTGAGKSTLVNLLMRFYELNEGSITIDGIDINSISRENVHDMFDMILQDTWLFNGTIRENLVYNKASVSDDTLDKVCKAVGLEHLISSLSNGYDTVLDDSSSLSEGQKQQLTIARAMIRDAALLILDEATSSVDTRTEKIIQEAMDALTVNRTSFVIAHRLSTIKNADIILVLKDGDITEKGNHHQLLEANGFYAELYNSQFEQVA